MLAPGRAGADRLWRLGAQRPGTKRASPLTIGGGSLATGVPDVAEMGRPLDLSTLYRHRFSEAEVARKNRIWKVLCRTFFARHVGPTDTVVDIGAGYCEFINNITCGRRVAVDPNPDVRRFAHSDVEVLNESSTAVSSLRGDSVDVVFMSNFLEHLPDKATVLETLRECRRLLRPGGRVIVLQPNIRYLGGAYWDFFDHYTPLTDRSLVEAFELVGLQPKVVIPRFLPYTTKSRLPAAPWLVWLYLKVPPVWRILGKQTLVVATLPD